MAWPNGFRHPPSPAQSPANSPPKVGKSVAWSPDTQNGQTPQTQEMTVLSPSDNRISSLCKELLKKRHAAGCIGFLDDEENREYYVHSVYPSNSEGNDLSLAQLLSRNDPSNAHALLLRDKYELSVILATSVLQLHTTPWLEDGLWKEDVRFVRTKMKTQSAPYAYIQKRFESVSSNGTSPRRYSSSNPTIRNDTIFALGVSLIELSLGRTLRSFAEEQDLGPDGQPNEVTDLSIARRLLTERIQPSEGERYANAVNRCIHCLFDGINPSLEDDAFRHAFYQGAVVPLKEIRDEFIK
ncbi:hypothetical protein EJ08DRAFT_483600 [Tothia fuscella]|uniref:DUF7580 domain-containing protein n=1 Tax=Tothia fuscella TaxID=1048955 RepID=A0A9P4TTD0_9PEZI|nr:hypothetical protein EJ08DRAFT_483600 [Tothia fuscella]